MLVYAVLCLFALLNVSFTTSKAVDFTFCYEQQEYLPHFRTSSIYPPKENPGAAIEIIQAIDKQVAEVTIALKRDNWSRCINGLKTGKVSGVLGSYSKARALFSQYPMKENQIDNSRSFSKVAVCLFHHNDEQIQWDGTTMVFTSRPVVAISRGYQTIETLKALNLDIYQTDTTERAHNLLISKKVTASTAECDYDGFPKSIVPLLPPLRHDYGYLIISNIFYQNHQALSEKLWDNLAQIDLAHFYSKYSKND